MLQKVREPEFIRYRDGLLNILEDQPCNCGVSFALNEQEQSAAYVSKRIDFFIRGFNKSLLGRRWFENKEEQLQGVVFLEKLDFNAHAHGQMYIGDRFINTPESLKRTEAKMTKYWKKVVGDQGTIDLLTYYRADDNFTPSEWATYITKEFAKHPYKSRAEFIFVGGKHTISETKTSTVLPQGVL